MFRVFLMLIPCATLLTLSAGCSSSVSKPVRTHVQREQPRDRKAVYAPDRRSAKRYERAAPVEARRFEETRVDRSAPPPSWRESQRADLADQNGRVTMTADTEPPLMRLETPTRQIRPDEFWVAGNWRGETGAYVWESGRIEETRAGQQFAPGGWVKTGQGWEYSPEYWH